MDDVIKNFLPHRNYLEEITYELCERYAQDIDKSLIERGFNYVTIRFSDGQIIRISQEKR